MRNPTFYISTESWEAKYCCGWRNVSSYFKRINFVLDHIMSYVFHLIEDWVLRSYVHIVEVEEMCLPILKEFNFVLDHIMSFIRLQIEKSGGQVDANVWIFIRGQFQIISGCSLQDLFYLWWKNQQSIVKLLRVRSLFIFRFWLGPLSPGSLITLRSMIRTKTMRDPNFT